MFIVCALGSYLPFLLEISQPTCTLYTIIKWKTIVYCRRKPGTYQRGTLSDYFPNNRSRDNGERRTGVTTQLKVPCRYAGKDKDPNVRSSSRCSYEDKADDKLSVEDGGTSELYHSVTKLSKRNKKNARILYKHEPNARSRHQKVPKFSRHNRSDARFYYNYEAKKSGRGEHCSRLPHRDEHDRMFFKMCQPGSRKPFDSREPPGKTLVSEKKIPYQSREAHEASLNTENNEQLAGGSSRNYNKYSRTEGSKPTNCKEFKYDTVDLDSAEREKTGYLKDVKKPNRSRKNDSQTQTENFGMDANSLNNARSRGRRDVIRSTDALTNSKHSRENNKSSQDGSKNNRRSGPDREMEHEKEILYTGKRNVSVSESSQQSAMAMSWPANVLLKRNLEKNAENRSQSVQSDDSRRFSRDKDANVLEDLEYRKMHFGDNKLPRPDNIDVSPVVRETRSYNKARTGGQTAYVPANRNSKFVNSRYDTRSNQRERIDNCFLGERGGDGFEGRSANDKIVATRCEAKVGSREQQRAGIKSIEKSYICCTYTSRENKQDTRLLSDISKHKHVTKGQYTYSTNYLDNLKNAMSDVTLSESEPRCSGLDIMAKREYKNEGDVDFRGSPQGTIGFAKEKPNYIDQIKELNVKDFDLRSAGSGEWDSRLSNKKVDTMMTGDSQDIKMRQLDQHERGAKLLIDQRVDTWDRSESYNKLSLHENKPGVDQRSVCSTINLFRNQFIREQNSGVRGYETQSSHEVFHRSRFESDKRYANLGRNKPERRLNVDEDERLNRSNVSKHGSRNEDVYKDRSVSGNEDDERKSKFDRDEPFRRIPRHNAGYGSDSEYQCGDDKFRHVFRDSRFSRKDNQPQINKHDSRKPDSRLNRGGYNARPHREEYVRSNTDTHRTNYKMYRDYQQDTEWENFEHRNRFVTNKHVITNKQDTRLRCGRNDDRFYAPDDEDKMEEFRRGHFEPGSGWLVQLKNCKKNEIEDSKENFEKECVDKILPGTGISNADIQHLDDILLSGEDLENVNYDTDDRDSNRWYRMTLEEEREEEKMSCSKTLPMEKDKFEKSGDFVHESHNTGMIHKSRDQKKDEIERKSGETKKIEKENSEKYNMREMSSVGCSPKHVRNKEKRERIATRVFQNSRFAVDDSQLLSRKFADEVGYSTDLRYPENECVSQKKIRQHSFDDSRNTDCSDLDFSDGEHGDIVC